MYLQEFSDPIQLYNARYIIDFQQHNKIRAMQRTDLRRIHVSTVTMVNDDQLTFGSWNSILAYATSNYEAYKNETAT